MSPTNKGDKERLRQLKLIEEEKENFETDFIGTALA
jgi:hypothetical protein